MKPIIFEKNIVIVGGSIAGCAMAILLRRLGANVIVLERSAGQFNDQGAGITLPTPFIDQCVALDLFDKNIPRLVVNSRSFSRKSKAAIQDAEKFWIQPVQGMALNWMDIYRNLKGRLEKNNYQVQTTVQKIQKTPDGFQVETTTGKMIFADLVIAADGVDSTVRKHFIPDAVEAYAGYIAWRGVVEDTEFNADQHVPYCFFPAGHILLYRIPASDYAITGKTLLNWIIYENNQEKPLSELLKDKKGNIHTRSLSAENLSDDKIKYLHALAQSQLPKFISDVVCKTPNPFIQAIFDFQLPSYENNDLIFVGDAAATLRPHSGSGVLKALMNAMTFYKLISDNPSISASTLISEWKLMQQKTNFEEIQKAKNMGEALVTHQPDWYAMSQESTDQWWSHIMQGKTWYGTDKR